MSAYSLKCLSFGGTDEYATFGDILGFERTQSFSISFWMRSLNTGGGYILSKYDYSTNKGYRLFGSVGGASVVWSMNCDAGTSISRGSSSAYPFVCGSWVHVVLTYNGSSASTGLHIWRNAASADGTISGGPLTSTIVTTAPFQLGAWTSSSYYTGRMDEVAVYDKVLSGAEIAWIYNSGEPRALDDSGCPSNLVAWWRMGEWDVPSKLTLLDSGPSAVAPTVRDLSGSNFTGTMQNMEAGDIVADVSGGTFATKSLLFGGTDEYVAIGNVLDYERTSPFSISFWFKTTDASGPYLINKMGAATAYRGYGVAMETTGELTFVLRNDNATTNRILVRTVTSGYNGGTWHHAVWTYDGSSTAAGCKCYIDGSSVSLTTVTDALSGTIVTTDPLWLGAAYYGGVPGSYYTGNLDEVSIHSKALSSTEVTWIYNSGAPRNLKDSAAPSGLVAWWRLGEGAYQGALTNMETTDLEDVYRTGGLITYPEYSDGKFSERVGSYITYPEYPVQRDNRRPPYDSSVSVPRSKNFRGRPVMTCNLVGDEVPHYYKMRARDSGATPPGYVTWMATFSPDFTGDGYSSGTPTPIGPMVAGSAVVADEWWEGED